MKVLKLRLTSDDSPGFTLEFEIRSDQTFKVMHDFLVKTLKLEGNELASFYVADENWQKHEEITLLDMGGDEDSDITDEDELQTIYLMEDTPLEKFIKDIDQYLIYEYDFLQLHTFNIECFDTGHVDKRLKYPRIIEQKGKYLSKDRIHIEHDPEKLKEQLLKDFNSFITGDIDDEDDGYSEDF